jgi:hypothetical protein
MRLLTIILLTFSSAVYGQTSPGKKPITLTYYTFGIARGYYVDTETLYGLKLKWKGCIIKNRHVRHNKKVEEKINKRLGENWLASNFKNLEL